MEINLILYKFQHYLQDTMESPVGDPGNQFIRTLTTEVAESTIIGNVVFSLYSNFLRRFIFHFYPSVIYIIF